MSAPLSIYVLVNGLGWEVLRERPFLDDELTERRWLVTTLGYSSGAVPSLLTGMTPSEHGHWNPAQRRSLTLVARRAAESRGDRAHPLTHVDLAGKHDPYVPGALNRPSIFDDLAQAGIPYECYAAPAGTDADVLARVSERAARSEARVLFVALSGLDRHLHLNIHAPDAVRETLGWYEAGLRRVWQAAGQARGDLRLFVFSDHGVTPIRWTHDLRRDVQALGLRIPADYVPVYEPTMARFWVNSERAHKALTALLAEHPCGTLMTPAELQRLGVWFEDGRYYDLLFVLKPGMLLCPSDMGARRFTGMYGYHPSEPTADGVLLSSVPVDKSVDHITGVRGALREDLGLAAVAQAA